MGKAEVADPRSVRPLNQAWLGGVCAGLAGHLGWSVLVLRVVFVVAAALNLFGVVAYFALWLVMPQSRGEREAPGLAAGARSGLRSPSGQGWSSVDLVGASALALLGVGLGWLVQASGYGLARWLLVAGLLAAGGVGIIWWQADHVSTRDFGSGTGWRRLVAPLVAHWTSILAIGIGLTAVGLSIAVVLLGQPHLSEAVRLVVALGLSVAAMLLAVLPWALRVRRELAQARDDALVADARADMAAHLHDSVLQTLALIQRKAGDAKAVTALARRQERELRQWLYAEPAGGGTLVEAIGAEIIDVEDTHGVDIELVSVGDAELTAESSSLVRAAREAMVNAAKHSGCERIDVYLEVEPDLVSLFVRDRGTGFDLAGMDADRLGVRHSIVERMKRSGGRAIIRTAPAEGTEVRLELPR